MLRPAQSSVLVRLGTLLGVFSCLLFLAMGASAATKHSVDSSFPSYTGLVMAGYQGWFRAAGDGSQEGWTHYGSRGKFDPAHLVIDYWPDVSEYSRTYTTPFKLPDGSPARVFSPWDKSTVDVHFRWLRDYGIDGVFMQRFFHVTRTEESRRQARVILGHALKASQKYGRAIAVMYDLSGMDSGEDCSTIIQDWKELVDKMGITSQGVNQTYLYHRGKPLVVVWGLGFRDRDYDIRRIGIDKLIDFLKSDPQYGGCSLMLGVPTHFRELRMDTRPDPYLHEIMGKADVILPWMVGRFSGSRPEEMERYSAQVTADIAWCSERKLDYVPCVYPGFSWYNLKKGHDPFNAIPRQRGKFYGGLINSAIKSGAKMLYVAMFDEMNEGTAIFKCTNNPPTDGAKFLAYEGLSSDHYLWLTGQAGRMLRREIPLSPELYRQTNHSRTTTTHE